MRNTSINYSLAICAFVFSQAFAQTTLNNQSASAAMSEPVTLQFYNQQHFNQAMLIHDTVMGGRSKGNARLMSENNGVLFVGDLSLENNGGFASIEFNLAQALPKQRFQQVVLATVADGRTYQLRLKTPYIPRGVAYVAEFKTTADVQRYAFNLADFQGRYRGRALTNMPELHFKDVQQVSLMLADKNPGPFRIELYDLQFNQ
ncbi:MAG: CIA30 family protein [Alishewanella sp.]|nr:CIA30 family protein [Alishewanella sp.]